MARLRRNFPAVLFALLALPPCAPGCGYPPGVAGRPGAHPSPPGGPSGQAGPAAPWPYAGILEVPREEWRRSSGQLFSGYLMDLDPVRGHLFATGWRQGSITVFDVGSLRIDSVLEVGEEANIENLLVDPDGRRLLIVANTLRPQNLGYISLTRALLVVRLDSRLLAAAIPLGVESASLAMAVGRDGSYAYVLAGAVSDLAAAASLTTIDLVTGTRARTTPVGDVPVSRLGGALAADAWDRRVYCFTVDTLAAVGGGPPLTETSLTAIDPATGEKVAKIPLDPGFRYAGIVFDPDRRAIYCLGSGERHSRILAYGTPHYERIGFLDVPDRVESISLARGTDRLYLAGGNGLSVVDLRILSFAARVYSPSLQGTAARASPDGQFAFLLGTGRGIADAPGLAVIRLPEGTITSYVR